MLVAVSLVAASPASAGHCINLDVEPLPPYTPPQEIGDAQLCDSNSDSRPDTLKFQTRPVTTDGEVTVAREQHVSPNSNTETTQAEVLFYAGVPLEPTVYNEVEIEDRDNDEQVNRVESHGGVWVDGPTDDQAEHYRLALMDLDNDGVLDAYAFVVCVLDTGCKAPGPEDLPEHIPDQNDLPDLVFYVEPIGYVP